MNVYLADFHSHGRIIALEYEAADDNEAQLIADENGWEYLGQLFWVEPCDETVEAIIQKHTSEIH